MRGQRDYMSSFNFVKAVRQISMPPTTKLVAITLATYADYETGECYPSIQTLMDDTGLSNRVVCQHIKNIEKMGILVADRSNGRRSYYRFDVEILSKAVTQGHSSENESSDSDNNTSDSDDIEPVTFMQQPVTFVQKAVTQSHTNYQEQPIEQPIERSSNTHEEKISQPPVQFVQYHNFDLAKISVIELGQKYSTLKSDFIELSKPRHPDLDQHDLENLFDEFGEGFDELNPHPRAESQSKAFKDMYVRIVSNAKLMGEVQSFTDPVGALKAPKDDVRRITTCPPELMAQVKGINKNSNAGRA